MANGDPIVAWAEAGQGGVFEISAARWDGEAWVVLGDGLNEDSAADALDPSLAFRGTGRFFVFEGRGP